MSSKGPSAPGTRGSTVRKITLTDPVIARWAWKQISDLYTRRKEGKTLVTKSTISFDVGRLTQEELNRKYPTFNYICFGKTVSLLVFLQELNRSIEYFRPVNISKEHKKKEMLEWSSVGYKGLVPRISYSRYFTVDNDASNEDILQEAKISNNTTRTAGDGRQKSTYCDKIKSRGTSELEKKGGSATENKIDLAGKKYLLPPPPKFKASTVKTSPREELHANNRREDMKLRGQLPQLCNEFSPKSCRCALGKSVDMRPSSVNSSSMFTDEEMQRLKIINSWMQFFG